MTTTPEIGVTYLDGVAQNPSTRSSILVSTSEFVAKLLDVAGDVRFLWMPSLTGTTDTEKTRHGATVTYSENLSSFDVVPAKLGNGNFVTFNGTDEEGDTPNNARLSFGDGANDESLSFVALINPDEAGSDSVFSKREDTIAEEYNLRISSSSKFEIFLFDNSASAATIGRPSSSSFSAGSWALGSITYDGAGVNTGIHVYKDGVLDDGTPTSSGSYTAMEALATKPAIAHYLSSSSTPTDFFNGKIAFILATGKELSADDQWVIKGLVNAYYGLSL